eukprot:152974-Pelagomonas_calceolata.AAC.3
MNHPASPAAATAVAAAKEPRIKRPSSDAGTQTKLGRTPQKAHIHATRNGRLPACASSLPSILTPDAVPAGQAHSSLVAQQQAGGFGLHGGGQGGRDPAGQIQQVAADALSMDSDAEVRACHAKAAGGLALCVCVCV